MLHHIVPIMLLVGTAAATPAATAERGISFGSISLAEEVYAPNPGELPILDVPREGTTLHLRWQASAGGFQAELIDNGSTLRIVISGHDCSSVQSDLRYERHLGEDALWRRMGLLLRELTRLCSRITPAQAAHYKQELQAAQDDYVAAVEAMKKRAIALFRRPLTRCRPSKLPAVPLDFLSSCRGEW